MLIVLTGIDGSGKTTAAEATVAAARQAGKSALLLRNYAGRRRMSLLSARLGIQAPPRLADFLETAIRTFNVLNSHRRARNFHGLVVMDRHLHCQLALRGMHGLPRGRFLPWLIRTLPRPDLVIYLDVDPREAHATDPRARHRLGKPRGPGVAAGRVSIPSRVPRVHPHRCRRDPCRGAGPGARRHRERRRSRRPDGCSPPAPHRPARVRGPVPSGPGTPRAAGALPPPAPESCRCPWPCSGTSDPWPGSGTPPRSASGRSARVRQRRRCIRGRGS